MNLRMSFFAIISLLPAPLMGIAILWGGGWVVVALAYQTLLAATLDEWVAMALPEPDGREFAATNLLSVLLAIVHFGLLTGMIWALGSDHLAFWEKLPLFLAAGLFFGQVSNSNAHELIHRGSRGLHHLGMWVYISLLFGHHTSAHPLVHHIHVATDRDPNSARLGESYYRFARRAWRGSFLAGLTAENKRSTQINRAIWQHPYLIYLVGAVAFMGMSIIIQGLAGLMALILLASFAQSQLLISDYVQHYGLRRCTDDNGKSEPVSNRHSWNAQHWFTSSLMLNAPRHSDHHAHPSRPYPDLRLTDDMPQLPYSLPVMATLALWPKHWKRVMDPRVHAIVLQQDPHPGK